MFEFRVARKCRPEYVSRIIGPKLTVACEQVLLSPLTLDHFVINVYETGRCVSSFGVNVLEIEGHFFPFDYVDGEDGPYNFRVETDHYEHATSKVPYETTVRYADWDTCDAHGEGYTSKIEAVLASIKGYDENILAIHGI